MECDLSFLGWIVNQPIVGRCTLCGLEFIDMQKHDEHIDDAILRMRSSFEEHSCCAEMMPVTRVMQ